MYTRRRSSSYCHEKGYLGAAERPYCCEQGYTYGVSKREHFDDFRTYRELPHPAQPDHFLLPDLGRQKRSIRGHTWSPLLRHRQLRRD